MVVSADSASPNLLTCFAFSAPKHEITSWAKLRQECDHIVLYPESISRLHIRTKHNQGLYKLQGKKEYFCETMRHTFSFLFFFSFLTFHFHLQGNSSAVPALLTFISGAAGRGGEPIDRTRAERGSEGPGSSWASVCCHRCCCQEGHVQMCWNQWARETRWVCIPKCQKMASA